MNWQHISTNALSISLFFLSTPAFCLVNPSTEIESNAISSLPTSPSAIKINLNTADVATLKQLPGIGLYKAKAIVDYRQQIGEFTNIQELLAIKGFNWELLHKIAEYIVFF